MKTPSEGAHTVSTPTRSAAPRLRRAAASIAVLAAVALITSCSPEQIQRGWLPTGEGTTDQTDGVVRLWTGSWIAALIVGCIVWGLIVWCVIVYRKRKEDHQLPVQLRYHVPLELLYTFVPVLMVGVLFFYTVQTQDSITEVDEDETDVHIQVYGRQWSWDFNYLDYNVWDSGEPADLQSLPDGQAGLDAYEQQEQVPTLVLPVDQTVTFELNSRDVIHSFWIPAFLYKIDTTPGRTNTVQLTPQEEGLYYGRCAELCGEYHGYMLFNVEVVSQEEFEQHMADLAAAGQTGVLGEEYDRQVAPDDPNFGEEEDH